MADSPFAGLGLDFMRWQNAPSLTGGAFEKIGGGIKKALLTKAAEGSGLVGFLDSLGQTQPGVAPPVQVPAGPVTPMVPAIGVPPQLAPLPALGQQEQPEEPQDYNLMIWGKR